MTNTRNTYNRTLTDFMLYLFTNSNAKLVNIAPLTAAKVVDDARSTPKQREAKRSFGKECGNKLRQMNRIEGNLPIHLTGQNSINYNDIAKYMGKKRRIVDVDPDLAN